ncbi:hypothetical protein [Streptomyces sp. NRRL F-5630]|uniref:hypothetical protein n=1 Tax=Streptomyces sp. NRRL F-5630 TaxID=1463864 RepID=UPI003D70BB59
MTDTGNIVMLFIGPEAEKRFGRRQFMELTTSLTAPSEFTVLAGRTEFGTTDPTVLTEEWSGPRRLLLAGRSWQVTFIDWARRRAFVEPVEDGGIAKLAGQRSPRAVLRPHPRHARRPTRHRPGRPPHPPRQRGPCRTQHGPHTHEVHPAGALLVHDADATRW